MWDLTRDRRVVAVWYVFLILFMLGVGALTLPGHISLPSYIALVFYAFVPGYSFVEVLLGRTHRFEKLFVSIFFSIAFITGVKALDRTLTASTAATAGSNIAFLPSSPFEFGVVFSLTSISLVYLTWKAFGRPGFASSQITKRPKELIAAQKPADSD